MVVFGVKIMQNWIRLTEKSWYQGLAMQIILVRDGKHSSIMWCQLVVEN